MFFKHNNATFHLRALEPEDIEFLYKVENDEDLWEVTASNVPYSKEQLRSYILNSRGDIYADGELRLIIETEQKTPVGIIDITNFDPSNSRAELGITIAPECRKQGIGTAAIKKLCHYALRRLHLHQLYAIVCEDNKACLSCLEQAGFEQTASLAEWIYNDKCYKNAILLQYFL